MTRKVLLKEKEDLLTARKSAKAEAEAFRQSIFMRKNEDGDTEYVEPSEEDAGKYDALIAKLKGIAAAIEAIGKQEDADDSDETESEENSADSDEVPVDDDEDGKEQETTKIAEKHASIRGGSKQVMSKNFNINSKFTNYRDLSVGGEQTTRLAFAEYVAKKNGGSYRTAAEYMVKNFGDEGTAQAITSQRAYQVKTAVGPTTSTSGTTPLGFAQTPIELLRERNEFLSRLTRVPMPYGNLVWLRQRLGTTTSYVGENQNLPVTQNGWDLVPSTWKKFGGKTYATIEQIEFSPWEISAHCTSQLQFSDARFMEEEILNGTGSLGHVLGIYGSINTLTNHLVSTVDATTSIFSVQTIANDLERLQLAPSQQGADINGGFMITNRNVTAFLRQLRAPLSGLQAFPEVSTNRTFNDVPFIETMIVGTDDNSTAKQGNIWFLSPKHIKVADCNRYWVESDDRAVFNDGGTMVSCKDNDLVLFSSRGYFDLMVEHDVVCSVLQTNGWALNSQQAQRYYAQASSGWGAQITQGTFTTQG